MDKTEHIVPAYEQLTADELFYQLSYRGRFQILQHLAQNGPTHVSALCRLTGMGQAQCSQHLAKMRLYGLVKSEKRGTRCYYSIADENIRALLSWAEAFDMKLLHTEKIARLPHLGAIS